MADVEQIKRQLEAVHQELQNTSSFIENSTEIGSGKLKKLGIPLVNSLINLVDAVKQLADKIEDL